MHDRIGTNVDALTGGPNITASGPTDGNVTSLVCCRDGDHPPQHTSLDPGDLIPNAVVVRITNPPLRFRKKCGTGPRHRFRQQRAIQEEISCLSTMPPWADEWA
jgi:hypothetical protein